MSTLKRIIQSVLHPFDAIKVAQGYYAYCDSCDKIICGWLGSVDKDGITTRTCSACCEKENEGLEFRYENKDEEKQTVEYNAYDKNGNKVGRTVTISYFTKEQIEYTFKLLREIRSGKKHDTLD